MNILISACLLGVNCRYNGKDIHELETLTKTIKLLQQKHNLIPVCPEIYGGLETPREPSEIREGKVFSKGGKDVTENFVRGANEILKLAKFYDCELAILKERSPSCGFGEIYDGTFSGSIVKGNGITADLLTKHGLRVIGESKIREEFSEE